MSDLREAAEMALEALEMGLGQRPGDYEQAIKVATSATIALHKVLGQPKREWVGLTKGEIQEIVDRIKVDDLLVETSTWHIRFAQAVQRKLKEKNT